MLKGHKHFTKYILNYYTTRDSESCDFFFFI